MLLGWQVEQSAQGCDSQLPIPSWAQGLLLGSFVILCSWVTLSPSVPGLAFWFPRLAGEGG